MIKRWFLLLLFCCVSSVKHSLKGLITSTTGITNFPELIAAIVVDDLQVGTCYSDKRLESIDDTWKQLFDEYKLYDQTTEQCHEVLPRLLRTRLHYIMDHFNQTGGVHTLQGIQGYEWDEQTGETSSFMKSSYDGEDLMEFDLRTKTWISLKPNTDAIKQRWDDDKASNQRRVHVITQILPQLLKTYLRYKNNSVLRRDLPSVSLLQTSPSSPVSCYATGFYPDRAELFWRKDGEQIHEDVDQGEILPNHDGTFQMKVDLDLSSVRAEDWSSYDCVFQLSGVKDDITTKLDKTVIRTNWRTEISRHVSVLITVVLVVLCVVVVAAVGFVMYKKKKGERLTEVESERSIQEKSNRSAYEPRRSLCSSLVVLSAELSPPPPDQRSELAERLNPEA